MSHIINSEKDIAIMSQQLEKLRSKGYTSSILEEILNTMIPQNAEFPIEAVIGDSQSPAFFNELEKKIELNPEVLKIYLDKQLNTLTQVYPNLKEEIFNNYILLTLAHETEHYYQHLIVKGYVDFPYKLVVDGYKNLTMLKLPKDIKPIHAKRKINRFLRDSHDKKTLLERNANVEATDLLCQIAKYENNEKMLEILSRQLSFQQSLGYEFSNGSMERTYKRRQMSSVYHSFDFSEEIPTQDRVRYDLPLDKETRKKVLKKQFNIYKPSN